LTGRFDTALLLGDGRWASGGRVRHAPVRLPRFDAVARPRRWIAFFSLRLTVCETTTSEQSSQCHCQYHSHSKLPFEVAYEANKRDWEKFLGAEDVHSSLAATRLTNHAGNVVGRWPSRKCSPIPRLIAATAEGKIAPARCLYQRGRHGCDTHSEDAESDERPLTGHGSSSIRSLGSRISSIHSDPEMV
jgi:hypothetical protein